MMEKTLELELDGEFLRVTVIRKKQNKRKEWFAERKHWLDKTAEVW